MRLLIIKKENGSLLIECLKFFVVPPTNPYVPAGRLKAEPRESEMRLHSENQDSGMRSLIPGIRCLAFVGEEGWTLSDRCGYVVLWYPYLGDVA